MSSIPTPHLNEKSLEELEIFELLAKVIGRGEAARLARLYGCSEQTVRKWRNDPEADDDKEADPHGRRSPVELFLRFMDALNAISPARASTVWRRVEYEFADMQRIQGNDAMMKRWQAMKKANDLAREIVAVTNGDDDG
jgi:hypothetical protein